MKKKYYFLCLFFILFFIRVKAQQDVQMTQYMFNKLLYNPGYAGSNGNLCGTLHFRKQWTGFGSEPTNFALTADYLLFDKHGIGLKVVKDDLGNNSNLNLNLAYAYQYPLTIPGIGTGRLGGGIELGMYQKSINTNWKATDDYRTDNSIPNQSAGDIAFDLGLGVYYNIPNKLYFGVSTSHINKPLLTSSLSDKSSFKISLERHYFITGGYVYDIFKDKQWVVKPSMLIKGTSSSSLAFDLAALLNYKERYHGGFSYRVQDALTIIAGMKVIDNLLVSISYDLTTSEISKFSNGSPEVLVKYCRQVETSPKKQSYRSVIFL